MTRKLTPSQAYRLGYLRAFKKCTEDLHALKQRFDDDIASLKNEYADVAALANELRRVRQFRTERAVAQALIERTTSGAQLH